MHKLALGILVLACAVGARAQASAPAPSGFWSVFTDPSDLALASYAVAQVADSTTNWHFTVAGKDYDISPASRAAFAGGTIAGALTLAHYVPKAKKLVTGGLVIGTSILAGRAYAHTLTHGTPASAAAAPTIAFAVRIRR